MTFVSCVSSVAIGVADAVYETRSDRLLTGSVVLTSQTHGVINDQRQLVAVQRSIVTD